MKLLQKNTCCCIFLGMLFMAHISAQNNFNGVTSNSYDFNLAKALSLSNNNSYEQFGIKTTELRIGGYHDAIVIVDMYPANLPDLDWGDPPYLYGFRTVNEPPLPNYETDFQNVSYKKSFREQPCFFEDKTGCDTSPNGKKFDTNDFYIFKKTCWAIAKIIYYQVDYSPFKSLKDIEMKVHVVIEKMNLFPGHVNSIQLPGLEEITDFSGFVSKNELNVYPNPSMDGEFTVTFDIDVNQHDTVNYELRDENGAVVLQDMFIDLLPGPNTFKIGSTADLVPGMYYFKIYNPDVNLHETLYVNAYTMH